MPGLEKILAINFSSLTLLPCFVLPFAYFAFHSTHGPGSRGFKKANLLLIIFSVAVLSLVILKLIALGKTGGLEERMLILLHAAPAMLAIMIMRHDRAGAGSRPGGAGGDKLAASKDDTQYSPVPMNKAVDNVAWDDLVIGPQLKKELQSVISLLKDTNSAKKYGIDVPKGILMQGPPGTGKTSLAKVVANVAGLSFFNLRMDEVVSKWVGESEKNLTKLFEAAKKYSPAVVFIDEVDSIGKNRSGGGSAFQDNLLNHLLQLIDGVVKTEGLYIIAATNRAELVDDALKRPGRLNKVILVPLPNTINRRKMFELHLRKLTLEHGVDLDYLAMRTRGASGAVIKEVCNQAGLNAFQRESDKPKRDRSYIVNFDDLQRATDEFMKETEGKKFYTVS